MSITKEWTTARGLRIHYLKAGERGSAVLLLHGGGFDNASLAYGPCIGPLSQHHQVFAPDWPGYGASDKPKLNYTTEFFVDALDCFMATLGIEQANIVGLSMGGAIALGFTLRSPARVNKLVLVDSYGIGDQINLPYRPLTYILLRLPIVDKVVPAAFRSTRSVTRLRRSVVVNDTDSISDASGELDVTANLRKGIERASISWLRHELRWRSLRTDFSGRLHEVQVPTLLLHGREDPLIPVQFSERASSHLTDARLHILEQCGHLPPHEKSAEFTRVVLEFLSTTP